MALKNQNSNEPCELGFFERLNYYFGKLMTVRDFKTEQSYFNEKRWLLNRMTIGWGVVCGLAVEECNDKQVRVTSGLALDQYGNEILVCQPILVDIPGNGEMTASNDVSVQSQKTYFVCIRYNECLSEPVPNPVEECGSMKTECEYNRIREIFEIKLIELDSEDYDSIKDQCEHPYNPDRGPRADCNEFLAHPCTTILQDCPERNKGWLVLAKLILDNGIITKIDNCYCRRFVLSNDLLFQMASCLREELYSIRTDRRQYVPLLAHTLRGLKYRDGKIKMISSLDEADIKLEKNIDPFSIITDGDFIWFTDGIYDKENGTYYVQKLSRDGKKLESIPLDRPDFNYPTWGIAFDGVYMWVTHITPDKNLAKVTRIHAWDSTRKDSLDLNTDSDAREIVFDGKYMWISHENGLVTQVTVSNPSEQVVHDWKDKITATITDLAYDGNSLWVGFDENNGLIKIPLDSLEPSKPISISDGNPKGICFDGTHIWVGHEYGISKVDIDKLQQIDIASAQKFLTRLAFDGMYVWVIQPKENRVNRIEIFEVEPIGGVQTREIHPKENYEILRICFDGVFMWMTAVLQSEEGKKGIIYRLLI